jgi:molecular chaperone GrpE
MEKEEKKKETTEKSETEQAPEAETSQEPLKSAEENPGEENPAEEPPADESADEKKSAEPDWKDQYMRLLADFDNFKKRTARDREDTYRYAEADILKDILPIVDNLQLALAAVAGDKTGDGEAFVKGVKLVFDTFMSTLRDHGAEPFDSVGLELDTDRMEAIAHLPSADFDEGKVSIESKKGWMLRGKVLRAAQVVVSSGRPAGDKSGKDSAGAK